MSSRFYPLYSRGNPQLRIFLPNFWMKMVKKPNFKEPPNNITFQVSPEMTQLDVKNYLEKNFSKVRNMKILIKNISPWCEQAHI